VIYDPPEYTESSVISDPETWSERADGDARYTRADAHFICAAREMFMGTHENCFIKIKNGEKTEHFCKSEICSVIKEVRLSRSTATKN
jgi:hypothetical protein